MDLISVIVPVYKVEGYLNRCVESIVNQSYRNLEIILVDDGSPDNCPTICDEWASKDSRIKVIHKENGGLSDARNAGMAIAKGEYIGFVDSDDWIAQEMYERLLAPMVQDECDVSACSVQMIWEDDSQSCMLTVQENLVLNKNEAQLALLEETKLKQPVWYKLYRSEQIRDISFVKGKYHEDAFWSYQVIGRAKKVSIIDYVGYYYWQRSGSIMGEGYSFRRLDAIEAYCQRYKYMQEYFPELKAVALIKIWTGCMYHGQMALKYMDDENTEKVFSLLYDVLKDNKMTVKDYQNQKLMHRIWLIGAHINLKFICDVRNRLNIGL